MVNKVNEAMDWLEGRVQRIFGLQVTRPMITIKDETSNTWGQYVYEKHEIVLYPDIFDDEELTRRTLSHEYGHYIHDVILDSRRIRLPQEGRTEYSKVNGRENFAEAFECLLMADINIKRDMAVIKLVKKGIINKYLEGDKCVLVHYEGHKTSTKS
jgi:SprT-like family.